MPVTLEEMGQRYVQSIKYRIENSQQELQELVQHLQECENTLQFDSSKGKEGLGVGCNSEECSEEGCNGEG